MLSIIWIILRTILFKLLNIQIKQFGILKSITNYLLDLFNINSQTNLYNRNYDDVQKLIIEQRDLMNARSYNNNLHKHKRNNLRADALVIFAMAGLIICITVLVYCNNNLSTDLVLIIMNLLGFFISILDQVCRFEFGSSRSNKNFDDLL